MSRRRDTIDTVLIMDLVRGGGVTFAEIAREAGCSREYVRQLAAAEGIRGDDLGAERAKWPETRTAVCPRPWCGSEFEWEMRYATQNPPTFCSEECHHPVKMRTDYCYRCCNLIEGRMIMAGFREYTDGTTAQLRICTECSRKQCRGK